MENATKALIIAAAVLIVIVLIAVSIRILGSTKNVGNQVETVSSNLETSMFNSQFDSYFGNRMTGVQAKALISKTIVNNSQNPEHVVTIWIKFKNGSQDTSAHVNNPTITLLQNLQNKISDYNYYKIGTTSPNCSLIPGNNDNGYENGYIKCIQLTEL